MACPVILVCVFASPDVDFVIGANVGAKYRRSIMKVFGRSLDKKEGDGAKI